MTAWLPIDLIVGGCFPLWALSRRSVCCRFDRGLSLFFFLVVAIRNAIGLELGGGGGMAGQEKRLSPPTPGGQRRAQRQEGEGAGLVPVVKQKPRQEVAAMER
jgi:hypothetical protein